MKTQEEFLKIVDSLYTDASQMRDIMCEVLTALSENAHGPVIKPYVHNIKHQMEYADLAMRAMAKAHELERMNRRSCAEVQVAVYSMIIEEIRSLDKQLEEMSK